MMSASQMDQSKVDIALKCVGSNSHSYDFQ
jgi:hypothetical protein